MLATLPGLQHTSDAGLAEALQPPMIDVATTEPTPTDEALMRDFQSGSRAAFEELFARYRRPLFGFFRRRLNHAADTRAEDLTQETFLAVLRATERYEPRAPVRTYLYGIAFNLISAERRRQLREHPAVSQAPEPSTSSDTTAVVWIRQALAKLELSEREILMLREYEQLSYAEIAELLDLPVNTVRSRLFRARMALKSLLEAESGVDASAIPREVPVSTRSNSGHKTGHGSGHEPIPDLRPAQEEGPQ